MASLILERLAKAKAFGTGKYVDAPGKYVFEITKMIRNETGYKGETYITEMKIISADENGELALVKNKTTGEYEKVKVPLHMVGDSRSYVQVAEGKHADVALGNLMAHLEAASGADSGSVNTTELIEELYGKNQPLVGMRVEADCYQKLSVGNRTPITVFKWKHLGRVPAASSAQA